MSRDLQLFDDMEMQQFNKFNVHKGVKLSMIVGKLLLSSRSYQPSSDMNVKLTCTS